MLLNIAIVFGLILQMTILYKIHKYNNWFDKNGLKTDFYGNYVTNFRDCWKAAVKYIISQFFSSKFKNDNAVEPICLLSGGKCLKRRCIDYKPDSICINIYNG